MMPDFAFSRFTLVVLLLLLLLILLLSAPLLLPLSSLGDDAATEDRFRVDVDWPDAVVFLLRSAVLSLSFRVVSLGEFVAAAGAASLLAPMSRLVLLVIVLGGGRSGPASATAVVFTA